MDIFSLVGWVLFNGCLLYGALYGVLRLSHGCLHRPVRTDEALMLVVVGSSAAQVFATQSVGVGLRLLVLLSALAYLRHWVSRQATPAAINPPTLLLYRGCLLPGVLAEVSWSEADLRQHLRKRGIEELEQLYAVVLEANGSLVVIQPPAATPSYPLHFN